MEYVWMVIAGSLALAKGRSVIGWMILGYIFGFIGAIVLICLSTKQEKLASREQLGKDITAAFLTRKEFKDVNNVDDLLNQLEKK
jgi:L-amino acid N-acyltransferase YncA